MLATISLATISIASVNGQWAYDEEGNDASNWPDYYAECGYSRQSPIDLPIHSTITESCSNTLQLQWTSEVSHYVIQNSGKSLLAMPFDIDHSGGVDISSLEVLHHTNDTNIRLQNSFYHTYDSTVNREYCFDSLHFHWGETDADGSEHTVNGESFPLEVHLVHYSCDYNVAGEAITDYATGQANIKYDDENVLAVIGVIFEIGKPNLVLDKILDDMIIAGIYEKNKQTNPALLQLFYTEFDLKGLLPESRDIIAYLGSLTTPPCFETVRWHVLKERMTVSAEQMAKFRMLLASDDDNDTQAPNFRPTLPINGRTIYQCQEDIISDALYDDADTKDAYHKNDEEIIIIDEDEDDTLTATSGLEISESELTWRMVGIAFICLFSVTFIVCMIGVLCLYKNWDRAGGRPGSRKGTASFMDKAPIDE